MVYIKLTLAASRTFSPGGRFRFRLHDPYIEHRIIERSDVGGSDFCFFPLQMHASSSFIFSIISLTIASIIIAIPAPPTVP